MNSCLASLNQIFFNVLEFYGIPRFLTLSGVSLSWKRRIWPHDTQFRCRIKQKGKGSKNMYVKPTKSSTPNCCITSRDALFSKSVRFMCLNESFVTQSRSFLYLKTYFYQFFTDFSNLNELSLCSGNYFDDCYLQESNRISSVYVALLNAWCSVNNSKKNKKFRLQLVHFEFFNNRFIDSWIQQQSSKTFQRLTLLELSNDCFYNSCSERLNFTYLEEVTLEFDKITQIYFKETLIHFGQMKHVTIHSKICIFSTIDSASQHWFEEKFQWTHFSLSFDACRFLCRACGTTKVICCKDTSKSFLFPFHWRQFPDLKEFRHSSNIVFHTTPSENVVLVELKENQK